MPHSLIIGMTESGKTTLARYISAIYKKKKIKVMVLDPLQDPYWDTPHIYSDAEKFLEDAFAARNCALFIDESGEMIGRYSGVMGKLATRSRHYGHNSHFIVQRTAQLDKTVRDQCSEIFMFRVSLKDGQTLSDDYAVSELKESHTLKKGEFIQLTRFGSPKRRQIIWI